MLVAQELFLTLNAPRWILTIVRGSRGRWPNTGPPERNLTSEEPVVGPSLVLTLDL